MLPPSLGGIQQLVLQLVAPLQCMGFYRSGGLWILLLLRTLPQEKLRLGFHQGHCSRVLHHTG